MGSSRTGLSCRVKPFSKTWPVGKIHKKWLWSYLSHMHNTSWGSLHRRVHSIIKSSTLFRWQVEQSGAAGSFLLFWVPHVTCHWQYCQTVIYQCVWPCCCHREGRKSQVHVDSGPGFPFWARMVSLVAGPQVAEPRRVVCSSVSLAE